MKLTAVVLDCAKTSADWHSKRTKQFDSTRPTISKIRRESVIEMTRSSSDMRGLEGDSKASESMTVEKSGAVFANPETTSVSQLCRDRSQLAKSVSQLRWAYGKKTRTPLKLFDNMVLNASARVIFGRRVGSPHKKSGR